MSSGNTFEITKQVLTEVKEVVFVADHTGKILLHHGFEQPQNTEYDYRHKALTDVMALQNPNKHRAVNLARILEYVLRKKKNIKVEGLHVNIVEQKSFLANASLNYIGSNDFSGVVVTFHPQAKSNSSTHELDGNYDLNTQLPNKNLFYKTLENDIAYIDRYRVKAAILAVQIDELNTLTNTLGQAISNNLRRQVARRLEKLTRDSDYLAFSGEDTFYILLRKIGESKNAMRVAQVLKKALAAPFYLNGAEHYADFNYGIATYPGDGEDADAIIRHVTAAAHTARCNGKNHIQYFKKSLQERSERALQISNELRQGIRNNEFIVYYHPQVDSRTHEIKCVESLIRWKHTEKGFILPNHFIPISEENGFIRQLGNFVLETSFKQLAAWHELGYHNLQIAINLSVKQFQHGSLVEHLIETADRYKINPELVQLEITESFFIDNKDDLILQLYKLKYHGFQIVVDDFGTGYSCLSYLKELPINILKIDRSFVHGVPGCEKNNSLVKAIVDLASHLDIELLAEGIENAAQKEFLESLHCYEHQGFYYAKPLTATDTTNLLESGLKHLKSDDEDTLSA